MDIFLTEKSGNPKPLEIPSTERADLGLAGKIRDGLLQIVARLCLPSGERRHIWSGLRSTGRGTGL